MKNKQKEKKAATRYFITALHTLAAAGPVYFAGLAAARAGISISWYITAAAYLLLTLLCIICPAANNIRRKRRRGARLFDQRERLLKERDRAQKKRSRYEARIRRTITFFRAYELFIFILLFSCVFLCGNICKISPLFALALIPPLSGLFGLFSLPVNRRRINLPEGELFREDYPLLFAAVDRAKKATGITRSLRAFFDVGQCAGVCKIKKDVCLLLGTDSVGVMSEDELTQVIIHELAHLENGDLNLNARYKRWENSIVNMDIHTGIIARFLLVSRVTALGRLWDTYCRAATLAKERDADNYVKRHGDRQIFVNALAKMSAFGLYKSEPKELSWFYGANRMREHYLSDYLEAYFEALPQNEERWKALLLKEIPPLLDSHPIFNQRMAAMGVADFDISRPSDSEAFAREKREYMSLCDKKLFADKASFYPDKRYREYINPLERVGFYEQALKENYCFSSSELLSVANACEHLNRLELGLKLAMQVLDAEPDNTYALYHAGYIMLLQDDIKGIDYLYRAAEENRNFTDNALDLIGDYFLKNGLKDEIEDFRKRSIEISQDKVDSGKELGCVSRKDDLRAHEMPAEQLDSILAYMRRVGGKHIQKVYLIKKVINPEFFSWVFCIKFFKGTDKDIASDIYNAIFNNLDYRDEQYSLFSLDNKSVDEGVFKRVPGSLVLKNKSG